jgi:2'-5' RNA ligase
LVRKALPHGPWRIAWVKPDHIHLTLVFLGDTLRESVPTVESVMDDVTRSQSRFALRLKGTGWFGRGRLPRVIWAGAADPSGQLGMIQLALDTRLREVGFFWPPQEFVEHVTVGRVKEDQSRNELARILDELPEEEYGQCDVTQLSLVESRLTPTGPVYRTVHVALLQ